MATIGEVGSLGLEMERDEDFRDIGRSNKQLTQWSLGEDGMALTGIISCGSLACNVKLLVAFVNWWAIHHTSPTKIPVDTIKHEVREGKRM